jgi:hypothetical protein
MNYSNHHWNGETTNISPVINYLRTNHSRNSYYRYKGMETMEESIIRIDMLWLGIIPRKLAVIRNNHKRNTIEAISYNSKILPQRKLEQLVYKKPIKYYY